MNRDIVALILLVPLTQCGIFFITWVLAFGELNDHKWYSWTNLSLANLAILLFFWVPAIFIGVWVSVIMRVLL